MIIGCLILILFCLLGYISIEGLDFNENILGSISTFIGALIGAGITGLTAIKISKNQNETQLELFRAENELREKELKEEKFYLEQEKHSNQINALFYIEKDLIIIKNECEKLHNQFKIYVEPKGLYQTVSKVKHSDENCWIGIDNILSFDLKIRLRLFREQYDLFVELLKKSTIEFQDEIELIEIEIEDLESKKFNQNISQKEEVYLKQKYLKKLQLKSNFDYYYEEKRYAWERFKNLYYRDLAISFCKEVNIELSKSKNLCNINTEVDLSKYR